MTLAEWLQEGEARLRTGPHPERARPDAVLLLQHVTRRGRASLLAHGDEALDAETAAMFSRMVDRRRIGEPIQYISGTTEFYGLPFRVSRDVLIPRPETEHLVEKVMEVATWFDAPRIVDVGTGSGAIAVALAQNLPKATITATDISGAALAIAQENAELNEVGQRMRFLEGDLLAPLAGESFEIVVANPPYVLTGDSSILPLEVREYEPALALFAGEDGLDVFRRLIPEAFRALVPGGCIAVELGYGQVAGVSKLLANGGFQRMELIMDLRSVPRVAYALRP